MKILAPLTFCIFGLLFVGSVPVPASPPPVSITDRTAVALQPDWDLQLAFSALSCTVSIDCPYSPDVSCSSASNQCSTSADGQCVVCDGQVMGCCEKCTDSCRSHCDSRWEICIGGCFGNPTCENRCWSNRDICYRSCGCYQ